MKRNSSLDDNNTAKLEKNIKNVYRQALESPGASNAGLKFYDSELNFLPPEIRGMSFGCGNPVRYASLVPGMNVLDVGCGAGIDSLYAARLVSPGGKVAGFDITDEMVDKARVNAEKTGFSNVEFRTGTAETIPFQDGWANVAISNAVLHLVPDKLGAFRDILRVLKPDGRIVLADIVTDRPIPALLTMEYLASEGLFLYGGILTQKKYLDNIWEAGFSEVEILQTAVFDVMDEVKNLAGKSPRGDRDGWNRAIDELRQVKFKVVTMEARRQDSSEKVLLPCKCGNISEHSFYEVANVTINRNLRFLMTRRALNAFCCPYCGNAISYPRPFMFHDMERRIMVHVFPETMMSQREALENAMKEALQRAEDNFISLNLVFGSMELFDKFGSGYEKEFGSKSSAVVGDGAAGAVLAGGEFVKEQIDSIKMPDESVPARRGPAADESGRTDDDSMVDGGNSEDRSDKTIFRRFSALPAYCIKKLAKFFGGDGI